MNQKYRSLKRRLFRYGGVARLCHDPGNGAFSHLVLRRNPSGRFCFTISDLRHKQTIIIHQHRESFLIRAAIIGMGSWGQNLVNSVQGRSDVIRFVAGATRTPSKVTDFAAKHDIRLVESYDCILDDASVDAVVLATPHSMHAAQIMAAARAGKAVFTEKPLGLTRDSAQRAVAACAEHHVTIAVGYNWRFQPALQEIKRMLADGRLGKLLHVEGNFCGPSAYRFGRDHWRQQQDEGPAGGMTGRGVHIVDAMLYLADHIESVVAQSSRLVQDFGIDDTTSILFRFRERCYRLSRNRHRHCRDVADAGFWLARLG